MICEKCGAPVAPGDMFCGECGNMISLSDGGKAASARICKTCGSPLEPGDLFCGECGAPYVDSKPMVPAVEEEVPRYCSECGRRLDPGEEICHICEMLNSYIDSDKTADMSAVSTPAIHTSVGVEPESSFAGLKSTMKEPKEHKENEMELKRMASKFFKKPGEL